MTQEEKIKDLEERIAAMSSTDSALCADLEHWKKVASGSKGRNKQLMQDVEKWKAYGKEADEMNERRIAKIDEQTKIIEGLNSQVKQLGDVSKEQAEKIKKLREELVVANANLEYYKELPWYRRIFFKG